MQDNVMQSAFLTQRTVSNIPIVISWGGSISPEGFLSSVLLWLVIIVAVVGVSVTSSEGLEAVTSLNTSEAIPDENFHHFLRIWHHSGTQGWAKEFHQDRASSVKVPLQTSLANFGTVAPTTTYLMSFSWSGVPIGMLAFAMLQLVLQSCVILSQLVFPDALELHPEDFPYLLGDEPGYLR
ncbi:hypothetical protein Tco_0054532 [Tanacetum coccineum]